MSTLRIGTASVDLLLGGEGAVNCLEVLRSDGTLYVQLNR